MFDKLINDKNGYTLTVFLDCIKEAGGIDKISKNDLDLVIHKYTDVIAQDNFMDIYKLVASNESNRVIKIWTWIAGSAAVISTSIAIIGFLGGCTMIRLSIQNGLSITGAIVSLLGTWFLASSIVFEKINSIVARSSTYCGYNGPLLNSNIDLKIKSGYGTFLVVIGSVIQIFSATIQFPDVSVKYFPYWIFPATLTLVIFVYYYFVKSKIKKTQEYAEKMADSSCNDES